MTEPSSHLSAASATRRATGDPNVFLIPEEHLPAGFAAKVEAGGLVPAPTRPAATVLLARDSDDGPEVLLMRRSKRSGFAADAWVFPGGVVDEEDRDPAVMERLDGPTPMQWAERLGLTDPAEALAYVVAAVREAFEETGILLARVSDDATNPGGALSNIDVARRALLSSVVDLRQIFITRNLRMAGDELLYLAHWITPEPEPRRYDTRFFLARVDAEAVCTPHEEELTESVWLTARGAVHYFELGSLKMLPPTVHTLRRLAGYGTVGEIFAALADAPVPAVLPVMRRVADGVAIELPPEARL
ncbi:MAG TPA: NUDIX domain-containing protein [Longimicrobium sp.]|uniref:NUDIX hydrolase n=1 Tax=Longimicrobium sp. TaxID=2029185 RepID=UPI002EDB8242